MNNIDLDRSIVTRIDQHTLGYSLACGLNLRLLFPANN
ncbi:MAG: hypothetical protein ACI823_002040 [Chitinophagales bacterium]|jgi:hypothetical protein